MATFSERLKLLRQGKKLTQNQVASLFDITERGYRDYEIGKSTPNYERLIAIADFFDCSVDFLIGRANNPNSHRL